MYIFGASIFCPPIKSCKFFKHCPWKFNLKPPPNGVRRLLFWVLREGKYRNGLIPEGEGQNVEWVVSSLYRGCGPGIVVFICRKRGPRRKAENWVKAVARISRIGSSVRRRPGKRRRVDVLPPGLGGERFSHVAHNNGRLFCTSIFRFCSFSQKIPFFIDFPWSIAKH